MVDLRKLKKTLISKMQLKELNPSKGSLNILAIAPKQDPRKTIDAFKRVMIAYLTLNQTSLSPRVRVMETATTYAL